MLAEPQDLLVIGGGMTGAGIARDAALRGIRTALIDRADFGEGSSSRSSRMIHGGLRYLELGDFRLVFEASRERQTLLRIAPHLVWPRSFLFPVYAGGRVSRARLEAGLWLYDLLALFRNVRRHRILSKQGVLRSEPGLRDRGLRGGARYYDAQCDDARLTLANVRDAHRYGALVANYVSAERLEIADGRVRGARVVDRFSGAGGLVRALVVVNATGAWSDQVRGMSAAAPALRHTKGVHVAVSRARLGNTEAVTITSPIDGRVMFIVPWGDLSYVGTTDTDFEGDPADARAEAADVVYLLRSANAHFPHARLAPTDVVSTWTGVRPLLRPPDNRTPSAVSREHRLLFDLPGLISIVGGKLTTYRSMAAEVVDRTVDALHELDGRARPPRARTDRIPLPGGETGDLDLLVTDAERQGAGRPLAEYLVRLYGSEMPAILRLAQTDRSLAQPIIHGHPAIRAQLVHAVRREMAMTLRDLLIRRTHVFYEVSDQVLRAAPAIVDVVAGELGWDAARVATELAAYLREAERGNAFRSELTHASEAQQLG